MTYTRLGVAVFVCKVRWLHTVACQQHTTHT